jgi:hypothetical protein
MLHTLPHWRGGGAVRYYCPAKGGRNCLITSVMANWKQDLVFKWTVPTGTVQPLKFRDESRLIQSVQIKQRFGMVYLKF